MFTFVAYSYADACRNITTHTKNERTQFFRKIYLSLCLKNDMQLDSALNFEKMPCDESWIYCYDPETKRQSSQWKNAGSLRPKEDRQRKSTHKLLMIPFFDSTGMIYMHWVPTGQSTRNTMLRF